MILPGKLNYQKTSGKLFKKFHIEHLAYEDKTLSLKLNQFHIDWQITKLMTGTVWIDKIHLRGFDFTFKKITATKEEKKTASRFNIPVNIEVKSFQLQNFTTYYEDKPYLLNELQFALSINENHLRLKNLNLKLYNQQFIGNGKLALKYPYEASFELFEKTPPKLVLKIGGNYQNYHISAKTKDKFDVTLNANIRYLFNQKTSKIQLQWNNFSYSLNKHYIHSKSGKLNIRGNKDNYIIKTQGEITDSYYKNANFNLLAHGNSEQLSLTKGKLKLFNGQLNTTGYIRWSPALTWKVNIDARKLTYPESLPYPLKNLSFEINSHGNFKNQKLTTNTHIQNLHAYYGKNQIKGYATIDSKQNVLAKLTLSNNQIIIKGQLDNLLQANLTLQDLNAFSPNIPNLNTKIIGQAEIKSDQSGKLNLEIQKGVYKLPNHSQIPFSGGKIKANFDKKNFAIKGHILLTKDNYLNINIQNNYPKPYHFDKGKVQAELSVNISDLTFIDRLNNYTDKTKGHLQASLKLKGPLKAPIYHSKVVLKNTQTSIPEFGLNLNSVTLNIDGDNKSWQINGMISSKANKLSLNGKLSYLNQGLQANLSLKGQNFPLIQTPELYANISPNLNIVILNQQINVTGNTHIDKALIQQLPGSRSQTLPDDVVIVQHQSEGDNSSSKINYQINISISDDVRLDLYGLSANVAGKLKLIGAANAPLRAVGDLELVKGKFEAYGQKLTIDKGKLLFAGGLISNPGVNLTATRQFNTSGSTSGFASYFNTGFNNTVTVGLNVYGRLKDPKVKLFSTDTSLSQADILAMLVLGRTPTQDSLSSNEGQLLLKALSSLDLGGNTATGQMLSSLQHSFGLDNLSFENLSHYNQGDESITDSSVLVMRKSLSKKLSVQYGVGLGSNNYLLRFKYLLTQAWSIQIETSHDTNGFDIIYHYTRK